MAEKRPQTYANYTRFDPMFHYFLAPVTFLTLIATIWNAVRQRDVTSHLLMLLTLLLFLEVFLNRVYSLKVQDRVIRLEERLRLNSLLGEPYRARIDELTVRQLVALRFASDAELPGLAARALDEQLAPADIKKAIRAWRPDYFRV